MSRIHVAPLILTLSLLSVIVACDTSPQLTIPAGQQSAQFPAPDGIDPRNPHIERSTEFIDFDGVRTVRLEIPTGRVAVSQSNGSPGASLKVTEVIVVEGLGNEVLAALLTSSGVTAERSFVDDTRLDIEATIAEGLADADIVLDLRLVIPNGANLEIFLDNGAVEVGDLTGNVEIRTANGAVVVDHVFGNVIARTSKRPIQAIDVTGNVHVETSGADITMRLAPSDGGLVTARTVDGSIDLTIAQATAATLSLVATDGIVSANLSGFEVSNISTASGVLGGVLNGGGDGRIDAQTTDGEITFAGM